MQTALFFHGIISQIPETIYAVSLARTKQYNTSFGYIFIHHINADFFFGFGAIDGTYIKMASPEKALLDFLYLYPARSLLFKSLPEIELSKKFNKQQALSMLEKITVISRRNMVKARLVNILKKQNNTG